MVNSLVSFISLRMYSKLHFIDTVAKPKDRHVCALNCRHNLIMLAVIFTTLIVSRHRYEVSKLLRRTEVSKSDAFVHFIVESYFVECLLQIPAH